VSEDPHNDRRLLDAGDDLERPAAARAGVNLFVLVVCRKYRLGDANNVASHNPYGD
jgi:hypothetical protein